MEKLNYGVFVNEVLATMESLIPEGYEIRTQEVNKINLTLDGFTIVQVNQQTVKVAQVVYLNDLYAAYERKDTTIQQICEQIIQDIQKEPEANPINAEEIAGLLKDIQRYAFVRPFLRCRICNIQWNKEFLLHKPCMVIDGTDLALVFTIVLDFIQGTIVVTDAILSAWGVSLDQLYSDAYKNMAGDCRVMDFNGELVGIPQPEWLEEPKRYVITNKDMYFGAAMVLVPGLLKTIYARIGGFFVIPSSVHEVLIFEEEVTAERCAEMIAEVNEKIDVQDRLGCRPYWYDAEQDRLCIA